MSASTPTSETIGQMTREELARFVDERVQFLNGPYKVFSINGVFAYQRIRDGRTLEEVFNSIDANMWTPPPGAPTAQELLRQDRDA